MNRVDGPQSDEALMIAASRDDIESFETLVSRHQNRVYRMVWQSLRREEDAWDVSQEVFIKVYNARHSYVENAKFTTWLYRIANNAIIDKLRQLQRKQNTMSLGELVSEPTSKERTTHASLELGEIRGFMGEALSALSERQRSMVVLKYYEGFSVKEIAEVFECASGTVKATLFQAVRHLKNNLARSGIVSSEVTQ